MNLNPSSPSSNGKWTGLTDQKGLLRIADQYGVPGRLEWLRGYLFVENRNSMILSVRNGGGTPEKIIIEGDELEEVGKLSLLLLYQLMVFGFVTWKVEKHPQMGIWVHVYDPYLIQPKFRQSRKTGRYEMKLEPTDPKFSAYIRKSKYMILKPPHANEFTTSFATGLHRHLLDLKYPGAVISHTELAVAATWTGFYPGTQMQEIYWKDKNLTFLMRIRDHLMFKNMDPQQAIQLRMLSNIDSESLRAASEVGNALGLQQHYDDASFQSVHNLSDTSMLQLGNRAPTPIYSPMRIKKKNSIRRGLLNLYTPRVIRKKGEVPFTMYPPLAEPLMNKTEIVYRHLKDDIERLTFSIGKDMDHIFGTNYESDQQKYATGIMETSQQANHQIRNFTIRLTDILTDVYRSMHEFQHNLTNPIELPTPRLSFMNIPPEHSIRVHMNPMPRPPDLLVEKAFELAETMEEVALVSKLLLGIDVPMGGKKTHPATQVTQEEGEEITGKKRRRTQTQGVDKETQEVAPKPKKRKVSKKKKAKEPTSDTQEVS